MALSNSQLLTLNVISNTDLVFDGRTVGDILNAVEAAKGDITGGLTGDDWNKIISSSSKDNNFNGLIAINCIEKPNGFKAVTFVDNLSSPKEVNVVLADLPADYMWSGNIGSAVPESSIRAAAVDYISSLPQGLKGKIDVTGFSAGGNTAQFLAVKSDYVRNCVSFASPGFSAAFIAENRDRINIIKNNITVISSANDPIACLFTPIAGSVLFLETSDSLEYISEVHNPFVLLNDKGVLNPQAERSDFCEIVSDYSVKYFKGLDNKDFEVLKKSTVSLLLADGRKLSGLYELAFDDENSEAKINNYLIRYLKCYSENEKKRLLPIFISFVSPTLVMKHYIKLKLTNAVVPMSRLSLFIDKILKKIDKTRSDYIRLLFFEYINKLNAAFSLKTGKYSAYSSGGEIRINSGSLLDYADRLRAVSRRLINLDSRVKNLCYHSGVVDLNYVVRCNLVYENVWKINRYAEYCSSTSADFENAERTISSKL